jgi:hypothetical protein
MSQRIHLNPNNRPGQAPMNMGYAPSYTPDPIGGMGHRRTRSENEFVAKIQDVTGKIEDAIETYSQVSIGEAGGPRSVWSVRDRVFCCLRAAPQAALQPHRGRVALNAMGMFGQASSGWLDAGWGFVPPMRLDTAISPGRWLLGS